MTLILKNKHDRLAFQIGRRSAYQSTSETIDQLQEQLRAQQVQHRFDLAEKDRELAVALRELADARLEIARRETIAAFALAPSPSAMLH